MTRPLGMPVTFRQCAGFFHDGGGTTGILMLPAWGFEEMTIRRGWAEFAALLAGSGYTCLRFDWPGHGDSLGDTREMLSTEPWQDAVAEAAHWLRARGGIDRIILLGHGLGAMMAAHAVEAIAPDALVMMAPQRAGRAGLRELTLWGGFLASALHVAPQEGSDALDIGGFGLSQALAKAISQLSLDSLPHRDGLPVLLMERPTRPGDAEWADALGTAGHAVTRLDYAGYDQFVAVQTASTTPAADFARVVGWLGATIPAGQPAQQKRLPLPTPSPLQGGAYLEQPCLFGPERRMTGILCLPAREKAEAIVILVNSGFNPRIGWARSHVFLARKLAEAGIASFRIDTHGIGDSACRPAPECPLIYHDHQVEDVEAAIDALAAMGHGPIVVFGRCSGAYAAIQAAVRDSRVEGLVAVNAVRLVLDPNETYEQLMQSGTTSMRAARSRAFSPALIADLLSGRVSMAHVLRRGTALLMKTGSHLAGRFGGSHSAFSQLRALAQAQAATLAARGVKPILVYAENDAGLDELAKHFGPLAPEAYRHADIRVVRDTEHNMTALHAREAMLAALIDAAQAAASRFRQAAA